MGWGCQIELVSIDISSLRDFPLLHLRQRHLQQENLLIPFMERFDFAVLGEAVSAVARVAIKSTASIEIDLRM